VVELGIYDETKRLVRTIRPTRDDTGLMTGAIISRVGGD
jgi:hypothetical protein